MLSRENSGSLLLGQRLFIVKVSCDGSCGLKEKREGGLGKREGGFRSLSANWNCPCGSVYFEVYQLLKLCWSWGLQPCWSLLFLFVWCLQSGWALDGMVVPPPFGLLPPVSRYHLTAESSFSYRGNQPNLILTPKRSIWGWRIGHPCTGQRLLLPSHCFSLRFLDNH